MKFLAVILILTALSTACGSEDYGDSGVASQPVRNTGKSAEQVTINRSGQHVIISGGDNGSISLSPSSYVGSCIRDDYNYDEYGALFRDSGATIVIEMKSAEQCRLLLKRVADYDN